MSAAAPEVIVVGSGASAVHAAYAIAERQIPVLMLDVGVRDRKYENLIPDQPFVQIRRSDPDQHRYFLGEQFEGVPLGRLGTGPQLTPPRRYIFENAESLSPIASRSFEALQSFAAGGLGGAWGGVAFPFLDRELVKAGLSPHEIGPHYEAIAQRIGVCGNQDDLDTVRGRLHSLLPPLELDHNAEKVFAAYEKKRDKLQRAGMCVGKSLMAVLTKPHGDRRAQAYHDMDFWSNAGESVYRPACTLRQLHEFPSFSYVDSCLVESFSEHNDCVRVQVRDLKTGVRSTIETHRLLLAAGALGTGKIVLRSFGQYNVPVPITCNPHYYVPCLHYRNLGAAHRDRCHSLAQLTAIYNPTGDGEHLAQAQLYSCRSLLLFRLLKESPLAYRHALQIMRGLYSSMVVWVIQFEAYQESANCCVLRRGPAGAPDRLEISYQTSDDTKRRVHQALKTFRHMMRELGCLPLRTVQPIDGSSVHYASLLPFSEEDRPLTTDPSGRLRGTRGVYVVDGAAFAYLPAKGLTLTLMANASRIAQHVAQKLIHSEPPN